MSARPWETEPTSDTFTHAGLLCHMRRGPLGAWCGYAGVPASHPLHGKHYSDCVKPLPGALENREPTSYSGIAMLAAAVLPDINASCPMDLAFDVHGGLTFASGTPRFAHEVDGAEGLWWFGFDCSHAGDFSPQMAAALGQSEPEQGEQWRDVEYVRGQLQLLARQLAIYATLPAQEAA